MIRVYLLLAIQLVSFQIPAAPAPEPENVAFYYGSEAPLGVLYAYDWVVLQQNQATDARIELLGRGGTRPLSYISIGEIARSHRLFRDIQANWILGRNEAWKSAVLDLRLPEVRRFILERLIAPAMARGFKGVFLDTLDSHLLTEQGRANGADFTRSQVAILESIREHWPDTRIIVNRGFHLPPASHRLVDAVAFESWRAGYDAGKNRYTRVSDADRDWLRAQLDQWRQSRPDIPLIAIDYLPDDASAREHAALLRAEGFIPYVTNGALDRLGPARPRVVKRHVLLMHDLAPEDMATSAAHRRLGIVLERSGLVPVYRSTRATPPSEPLEDRYAGVVIWWETGARSTEFCRWLKERQSPALPVVTFGMPPGQPACRALLGDVSTAIPEAPLAFGDRHGSVGQYEGGRLPLAPMSPLPAANSATSWLSATDKNGKQYQPIYTFASGGAALAPYVLETGPEDEAFWLFDPFEFLAEALHLELVPAADSTTESGRRILTSHIDGDGFVSRAELPGSPLSAEVILDRIITRYDIPHTVSVIEAEVSPDGLYPATSDQAQALARQLFQPDNVEIASHTYSHPFFWSAIEGGRVPGTEDTLYGYSLDIPGYTPTLEREIVGSVAYLNRNLAPAGKAVSVFLWTGDAQPGERALAMVRKLGLANVNGGDTHPLPYESGLAGVWPDARPVGDELQVYAPVMNENVYTNLWTGPFYGFRNVLDTFGILEQQGRLKPMGIYYHFYSGTKPEAVSTLEDIYRYALAQPVTPMFLSDYAERVQAQYYSALTVSDDGAFRWRGLQVPRTARVPRHLYPDLRRSTGVAGYNDAAGQRFVHLTGPDAALHLSPTPVTGPYLQSANASINHWQRSRHQNGWRITMQLQGHLPLELAIAGGRGCRVLEGPELTQKLLPDALVLASETVTAGRITLECR